MIDQKIVKMIHSMARANLNKSEELVTNTTAASRYIPTVVCKIVYKGYFLRF
jgi:hypothetical protein